MNDCKILCFEIRRYLHVCFDRDFLASAASRRDLWRMLLPLPGIMALVADSGNHELMLMDATLPGAGMRTPVTMGSGGMKAKELSLSKPEMQMREIILFLLGLPVETRETLEEAENYTFTMSHRAPPWSPESHLESKLVTFEGDTVSCARLLANSGLRVAMLNFAHGYNCGGGFEHAGGSQEEAIFRATSVFLSLWPHRRKDDGPGILKRGHWIGDFDEQLPRKEGR
ncbi:unnamed protein product [Durusdinium trenchii]|uniref:Microbial-type PARG catalytic domain-containing protein n=2 Tax=Durusdinium trenchii TaxID=1381693 RepID=A0ABP0LHJ8_9DINO